MACARPQTELGYITSQAKSWTVCRHGLTLFVSIAEMLPRTLAGPFPTLVQTLCRMQLGRCPAIGRQLLGQCTDSAEMVPGNCARYCSVIDRSLPGNCADDSPDTTRKLRRLLRKMLRGHCVGYWPDDSSDAARTNSGNNGGIVGGQSADSRCHCRPYSDKGMVSSKITGFHIPESRHKSRSPERIKMDDVDAPSGHFRNRK